MKLLFPESQDPPLFSWLSFFYGIDMLDSQIAAAEPIGPDENVMIANRLLKPDEIVDAILSEASERFPILKKPWWERRVQ